MASEERVMIVHIAVDEKPIQVTVDKTTVAEDVCIKVAKSLKISPIARHLFALRLLDKDVFLSQNCLLSQLRNNTCVFRLRYKLPNLKLLESTDMNAYNYCYHQARNDFISSKDTFEKCKKEAIGLVVTDMHRYKIEKNVDKAVVIQDYKKFLPRELYKSHLFFLKNPIEKYLCHIATKNTVQLKRLWMDQFSEINPSFLTEEYTAINEEGGHCRSVNLRVAPFHKDMPGVQIRTAGKKEWSQLCSIEDLCYVATKSDITVEISRKNGIPSYLRFPSIPLMVSFVSLLDGYYRLMVKWTFNLCKEIPTPSLKQLYSIKCHGPVGGEFSYAKLEEKRGNEPGCFILRESEHEYDTYYLDVCSKESRKPKTYKIDTQQEIDNAGKNKTVYVISSDNSKYDSIPELIAYHKIEGSEVWLHECLPPSEYDESRLRLCKLSDYTVQDFGRGASAVHAGPPQIIDFKTLMIYRTHKLNSKDSILNIQRSRWKAGKGKEIETVVKMVKTDCVQDFLTLASRWAKLQSSSVVRMLGVTLERPQTMVMEYLPLGPLNIYLQEKQGIIKTVDLVEACTNVASALWHLEEQKMVHGKIRCRKLLVAAHDENTFTVRLSDPGLRDYTPDDIHWIPPECYHNIASAKTTSTADVWAFGTTMWEIFTYGKAFPKVTDAEAVMKSYEMGLKQPVPSNCPQDVFQLMLECWEVDFHRRKRPQVIMRDINQILYQVFNSRRTHSYSVAFPKQFKDLAADTSSILSDSEMSMLSRDTIETLLDSNMDSYPISLSRVNMSHSGASSLMPNDWMLNDSREQLIAPGHAMSTEDISAMFNNSYFSACMTSIFELGPDVNVVLQGRIGQGFYGEVFKGTLDRLDGEAELVAVKKLKQDALGTTLQDFEREINIMKTLEHPNIVRIIGVFQEPEISLVMEFVQHGSLQTYLKIHKEKLLPEKHLLKFALDVARGMDYLGQKNIVHRDLAARNILVVDENNVKISDFGLAQVMGQNDYYILKTNRELPIKWYAPESLRDGKFSPRSDVWSYGVTLFEMFSFGEEPRIAAYENDQDHQELLNALERGARLACPEFCPQEIYVKLMAPCWEAESKDRPSFSTICEIINKLIGSM